MSVRSNWNLEKPFLWLSRKIARYPHLTFLYDEYSEMDRLKYFGTSTEARKAAAQRPWLKQWMAKTFLSAECERAFLDGGFDSRHKIYRMSEEQLVTCGISKPGHLQWVRNEIQKLQNAFPIVGDPLGIRNQHGVFYPWWVTYDNDRVSHSAFGAGTNEQFASCCSTQQQIMLMLCLSAFPGDLWRHMLSFLPICKTEQEWDHRPWLTSFLRKNFLSRQTVETFLEKMQRLADVGIDVQTFVGAMKRNDLIQCGITKPISLARVQVGVEALQRKIFRKSDWRRDDDEVSPDFPSPTDIELMAGDALEVRIESGEYPELYLPHVEQALEDTSATWDVEHWQHEAMKWTFVGAFTSASVPIPSVARVLAQNIGAEFLCQQKFLQGVLDFVNTTVSLGQTAQNGAYHLHRVRDGLVGVDFAEDISKVLQQVHPNKLQCTVDGMLVVDGLLHRTLDSIIEHAAEVASDRRVLTVHDFQYAVRLSLPGELVKHGVSEGTKAVIKNNENNGDLNTTRLVGHTANNTIALAYPAPHGNVFSVDKVKSLLSSKQNIACHNDALVFLAAVVGYMCAEILELSGNAARDNKSDAILPRHITLAIYNDEELSKCFDNVCWRGGGVLPDIKCMFLPWVKKHSFVSELFVYQEKDYHYQQQRRQKTTGTAALENYHENFKRCARRLSARAGVVAASDAALEQLKEAGKDYLQRVLHYAIVEAEHHHSTVIAVSHIHHGLRHGGFAAVVGVGSVGVHVVGEAFDVVGCAQAAEEVVEDSKKRAKEMLAQFDADAYIKEWNDTKSSACTRRENTRTGNDTYWGDNSDFLHLDSDAPLGLRDVLLDEKDYHKRREYILDEKEVWSPSQPMDALHKLSVQMVHQMQRSALPCFPRQNIVTACDEVIGSASGTTLDNLAYDVISVGYENYLCKITEDASLCAIHAKRIVVEQEDVAIALRIAHGLQLREK